MRVIERKMNKAISNRYDWKSANTRVEYEAGNEISRVFLYGNLIAEIGEGFLKLYDGGHQTTTTKSRLNAILSENGCGDKKVYQKDFQWKIKHDGIVEDFVSGMILR
jgi:hypothetical protein